MSAADQLEPRIRAVLEVAYDKAVLDGIELMVTLAPPGARALFEAAAAQARATVAAGRNL